MDQLLALLKARPGRTGVALTIETVKGATQTVHADYFDPLQ